MNLHFTKMHGAGNDFVMLDLISQRYRIRPQDARLLADRHYGIGCDQVIVVEAPSDPDVDFRYRIFNADGEEVEHCGNGARCFARFVRERNLTSKRVLRVAAACGILELRMRNNRDVQVSMGVPIFEPEDIPFNVDARANSYRVPLGGKDVEIGALSMGNPHAIIRVKDVHKADVERLGPLMESHPLFPQRVNASFMQVVSDQKVRLRVYERGVGETLACGTGACAAAVYGMQRGWLRDAVTVELAGGKLDVAWAGESESVRLIGPTAVVYEGTIKI